MEDKDNLPMIVGAVAAILAGIFLYAGRPDDAVAPALEPAVATPEWATPPDQTDQLALPSSIIQQQPRTRTVYECVKEGKRVFSDAPCDDNAKVRSLSPINVMDARQPVYQSDPDLNAPGRRNSTQDNTDTPARDCAMYEEEVKRIDARMRRSYTSWEGEQLRAQRHQAAEKREDCKRDNRLR